jgi:tryptophan halogenase
MNTPQRIRRVVIVGGGTAGWMTAAPLAQKFSRQLPVDGGPPTEVVLIESPEIGTIGVGEATLPTIRAYNATLGLDGADFIKRTQASFKVGIEFKDWKQVGERFFHGFGDFGPAINNLSSIQYWLHLRAVAENMPPYEDWSTSSVMARQMRFTPPTGEAAAPTNAYSYAFHFDAGLYAAYLREYAMGHGAQRIEGTITEVHQRPEDGFVTGVTLKDGRRVEGDLFIDCSGMRALLIGDTMQVPFEDWSHWLPVNRAQAVPSKRVEPLTPYTTSTARTAGWQWRIPLQHRTGNGHVYCSGFISDEEAGRQLIAGLDSEALDSPRLIKFTTGVRRECWRKNVIAVGLSSGFLEPLESTSIQLIMDAVGRIIQFFPETDCAPVLAAEFNRRMSTQYESIRDFIILHYKLTQRRDTEFWRHVADMAIPERLAHQIELFRRSGRVAVYDPDGFQEPSWQALMLGLGIQPAAYDPMVTLIDPRELLAHFARVRASIAQTVAAMPTHTDFIRANVRADPPMAKA